MPCYQCRAEFSFFKKELSCKACGFSFCSVCLSHEAKVPNSKKAQDKVCTSCYRKLTGTGKPKEEVDIDDYIPENFKKRVAEQEKRKTRPAPYKRDGAKSMDASSVEGRLAALQQERFKNVASVEEIEDRLRALRRQEKVSDAAENASSSNVLQGNVPADTADDLMARAVAEAKDEKKREGRERAENDAIAERLRKLKGEPEAIASASNEIRQEHLTEEEEIARLMKQMAEEAKIEEKFGVPVASGSNEEKEEREEELPWCCICNEDARVRCRGCDDDLFCQRCFREAHKGEDLSEHPTVPF